MTQGRFWAVCMFRRSGEDAGQRGGNGGLPVRNKRCILCPSGIATLDIGQPVLTVQESTGLNFETSGKDVSPTDDVIIGNSGTLGKAF
jgi:hypothetical protein